MPKIYNSTEEYLNENRERDISILGSLFGVSSKYLTDEYNKETVDACHTYLHYNKIYTITAIVLLPILLICLFISNSKNTILLSSSYIVIGILFITMLLCALKMNMTRNKILKQYKECSKYLNNINYGLFTDKNKADIYKNLMVSKTLMSDALLADTYNLKEIIKEKS